MDITIAEQRAVFEKWYRQHRKGNISENQFGDVDPIGNLLEWNGTDYKYGHPSSCWAAWRGFVSSNRITTEDEIS